ncbi:FecR domain-containing protein [Paraburkholderia sp. DGU8]|uniref:FecR family protein n=1 Tax=Paraburkholderia sp. DGU8 TaxID=3161997 RepID=UPI00346593E1
MSLPSIANVFRVLVLTCGCMAAANAHAADVAGTANPAHAAGVVKTVKGTVRIERAGSSSVAAVGSEVYSSDRVVTGPESSVGITLRDTTQLSAGANTTLELDQFAFNSTTHDGVLHASVKRGSLSVISGKLAHANPDSVRFRTPTTTLGVRGTAFIIEVGDKGERAR